MKDRLKRIINFIFSFNTIDDLRDFRLKCRDCGKTVTIGDSHIMPSRDNKETPVEVGLLAPHEFLEMEQAEGKLLDIRKDWSKVHFHCRCEECNNPFMFCYESSWWKIHFSNRRCRFCRWKRWGGLLLVIAFAGLIVS